MIGSIPISTKGRQRHRPNDGDPVLGVANALTVAAGLHQLSRRSGSYRLPARIAGIFQNGGTVGLVRLMTALLGRNAMGDTDRMSKPRRSFSPPM